MGENSIEASPRVSGNPPAFGLAGVIRPSVRTDSIGPPGRSLEDATGGRQSGEIRDGYRLWGRADWLAAASSRACATARRTRCQVFLAVCSDGAWPLASVRPSLANRADSRVHCRRRPPTALASWSWFSTIHQNREDLLAPRVISRTTPRRPFEFLDIAPGWPHILRTATSSSISFPAHLQRRTATRREWDGRGTQTGRVGWLYAPMHLWCFWSRLSHAS